MEHGDQRRVSAGSVEHEDQAAGGGIDLFALFWRARSAIIIWVTIVGLLYVGVAGLAWTWAPVRTVASQDLTFTFDGAAKGTYPNGTRFSPQDLLAEPVLNTVYDELKLADVMKPTQFAAGMSIRDGGGLDLMLLQADYSQKLQNAKLTQPEREKLEKEYRAALADMKGDVFVLSADFAEVRISQGMLVRVLDAVPAAWSRYAKQTRGLAAYDLPIPKVQIFDPKASMLDQWSMMTQELDQIDRGLRLALALPGAAQVRDGDGEGLAELQRHIAVLRRTRFEPLTDEVYAADADEGTRRLLANVEASEARYEAAKGSADAAREVFQQYVTLARGETPSRAAGPAAQSEARAPASAMPTTINLPEDLITRLVEMRSLEGDMKYRQQLNDDVIKSMTAMLEADRALRLDKRQLEKVQALGTGTGTGDLVRSVAEVKKQLAQYADTLSGFVGVLAERNLNPSSVLYRADGPAEVVAERTVSTRQVGLGFVGAVAVAMAIGLFTSLRRHTVAG